MGKLNTSCVEHYPFNVDKAVQGHFIKFNDFIFGTITCTGDDALSSDALDVRFALRLPGTYIK